LPQSIYEDQFREVRVSMMGAGVYGEVPLGAGGSLSYNAMGGSQSFDESGGYVTLYSSYGDGSDYKSEAGYTSAGQLIWNTPLDGLRLGGSFYYANELEWMGKAVNGAFAQMLGVPVGDIWGITYYDWVDVIASAEYVWNDLTLAAEYRSQETDSKLVAFDNANTSKKEGWYAGASYRFTDWFELGGYYSSYKSGNNTEDDIAISTRFDLNDSWIAKLEAHHLDGNLNSLGDLWGEKADDWWMFAAKLTYSF
jgi:predicted porin